MSSAAQGGYPIIDLRGYLHGAWRIERALSDLRHALDGSFSGIGMFEQAGADLHYREEGRLVFGSYDGAVTRAYRYVFTAPAQADVFFADGRPFHHLDLSAGCWATEHPCGDDRYDGRFRACGPDDWTVTWRLRGPAVNQLIQSRYYRLP